jgi:hypothetical protein
MDSIPAMAVSCNIVVYIPWPGSIEGFVSYYIDWQAELKK